MVRRKLLKVDIPAVDSEAEIVVVEPEQSDISVPKQVFEDNSEAGGTKDH